MHRDPTPLALTAPRRGAAPRGFTLIELLVVIVIIGALASLIAPRYFDQVGKSNAKIARAQIVAI